MALTISAESLAAGTNTSVVSGASAQLIGANTERNGLHVSLDSAAAGPVYLLLGAGTASATVFHLNLAAGSTWAGRIAGVLWRGAIQVFGTGGRVSVVEV